jgi:hypothetical protein
MKNLMAKTATINATIFPKARILISSAEKPMVD